jgi:5-methylcytosine-specific restriction endonuclease McrA
MKKTIRHIDTPNKLCYKCNSKAHIIINKKYSCALCELKRLGLKTNEYISLTQKPKDMC